MHNRRINRFTGTLAYVQGCHYLNIQTLRQQTEADHQAAESALPLMKADLNTAGYIHCLRKLYPLVAAWEEQAPSLSPIWLRALLITRNRRPLLDLDLAWFHMS